MALARVVTFDGVTKERIEELKREIGEGKPPEGLEPTEIIMLHDPEAERSMVVILFDDEETYRRGDAVLEAMPSGDTPGRRQSVTKYEVALRAKP
jgi:hypothetical protein